MSILTIFIVLVLAMIAIAFVTLFILGLCRAAAMQMPQEVGEDTGEYNE